MTSEILSISMASVLCVRVNSPRKKKKKSRQQGDVINVGMTEDAQKKPEAKHSVKIIIIISFYNLLYLKSEAVCQTGPTAPPAGETPHSSIRPLLVKKQEATTLHRSLEFHKSE